MRRISDGGGSEVLLGEERASRIGKGSRGGWHVCVSLQQTTSRWLARRPAVSTAESFISSI